MKKSLFALGLAAIIATSIPAVAQDSQQSNVGRELAELGFTSADVHDRGFLDMGDFLDFGDNVFVSMDYDENNKISLEEFMAWDYGLRPLSVERGLEQAYDTALKVVFSFWDRNGDGQISRTEHRRSLIRDFQRADLDSSATLDKPEFFGGFSIMVALRAALAPNR